MRQVIALVLVFNLQAMALESAVPEDCPGVLNECILLAKAQDQQIEHLKQSVKALEDKAVQEEPSIPTWYYVIIGIAGGYALGRVIR